MAGQHPLPGFRDGRGFSPAHAAVDIPAPAGTPVVAMGEGIVYGAGDDGLTPYNLDFAESGGGKLVAIRHRLTTPGSSRAPKPDVVTQYAHLSRIVVRQGQKVSAGQTIGYVGSTGNSTGNHLHLGVRIGGVWRDYRELLSMPGQLNASGVPGPASGMPEGYGSGPVQEAPTNIFGPLSAFPLDNGRTCPSGYNVGSVTPNIFESLPNDIWFNRPRRSDGTILACIRQGLEPGDRAGPSTDVPAAVDQLADQLAGFGDTFGDTARNAGLFLLFAVLLILGAWALVRR